jgi:hypothetical protein
MTPKEKAIRIYNKYMEMPYPTHTDRAKQCALIAVNELIKSAPSLIEIERIEHIKYWVNVGEEIEKL